VFAPSGEGGNAVPSSAEITPGLKRLLQEAAYGQLATLMPDGAPQVTQVWLDTDGKHILVNTVATHQKAKNARRDPRVAINVHDPAKPFRIANIRGRVVDETSAGAEQHIDALAKKYMGADRYPFGQPGQKRIILKIQPERIHTIGLDDDGWQPPKAGTQ
jgi:PPOX class probable F420-dependent enzyme